MSGIGPFLSIFKRQKGQLVSWGEKKKACGPGLRWTGLVLAKDWAFAGLHQICSFCFSVVFSNYINQRTSTPREN
jgi:hypothetical protein